MPSSVRRCLAHRTATLLLTLPALALASTAPASAANTGTIRADSATLNSAGQAVVRLTYTCTQGTDLTDTPPGGVVQVEQDARGVLGHQTFTALCDGRPHTTTVRVNATTPGGRDADYAPGEAQVTVSLTHYDFEQDAFVGFAAEDSAYTLS